MKTVFTTGEAAEICKVSQQTIIRCFDSGRLRGFRVPGSRFRRIPRDALIQFMKENGIPPDAVLTRIKGAWSDAALARGDASRSEWYNQLVMHCLEEYYKPVVE